MTRVARALGLSLAFALILPLVATARAEQAPLAQLQEDIAALFAERGLQALGIALIEDGELVWLDAFGTANPALGTPATPDTLFRTASISKMFIALAALGLEEAGELDLEVTLRELAPDIAFDNPWEAQHPVRLRHLLNHTSGWNDASLAEYAHRPAQPLPLGEALAQYGPSRHSRWVPGSRAAYSNSGSAVAAYLVERAAGMPYEDYLAQAWLTPLGMDSATFDPPDPERAAPAHGVQGPEPYWHLLYRPVGALNASPRELAALVQLLLGRGHYQGQALLSEAAIARMESPPGGLAHAAGIRGGYGLSNYVSGHNDRGVAFYGHSGSLVGAFSRLLYSPALNSGYVFLFTGKQSARHELDRQLRNYLLRDHTPAPASAQPLPADYRNLDGLYLHINPRHQRRDTYLPMALRSQRISTNDYALYREPLLENSGRRQHYYYDGHSPALIDPGSGLGAVAPVEDPLAGPVLHINSDVYRRVAPWQLWGEMGFWLVVLAGSALAVALMVAALPGALLGRSVIGARHWLLAPPAVSGLLLGGALLTLAQLPITDFVLLASRAPQTLSVFAFSLGYGLSALLAPLALLRLARAPDAAHAKVRLTLAWCLCLLHLLMAIYLASRGLIGIRVWTW